MDQEWFEVTEATTVVDESGTPIGSLSPGKRYKAIEVGDHDVIVGGAGGVRGSVPRSATNLPVAPAPVVQELPATPPPTTQPPVVPPPVEEPVVPPPVEEPVVPPPVEEPVVPPRVAPEVIQSVPTAPPEPEPVAESAAEPEDPMATRQIVVPPATPPSISPEGPDTVEKKKLPSWLVPMLLGLAAGAATVVVVMMLTSDSDEGDAVRTVDSTLPLATTVVAPTTVAPSPETTAPAPATTTPAPETTAPAPETTLPPVTTVAAPTTTEPPINFVEARVPGPDFIPPGPDTAPFYRPLDGTSGFGVTLCPSRNLSLFFDSVDGNNVPLRATGYGLIDEAGNGGVYIWYFDEAGTLVGFDQQGEPHQVGFTATGMAIRGPRLDLNLEYAWTWTGAHTPTLCTSIDNLVTTNVLPYR